MARSSADKDNWSQMEWLPSLSQQVVPLAFKYIFAMLSYPQNPSGNMVDKLLVSQMQL